MAETAAKPVAFDPFAQDETAAPAPQSAAKPVAFDPFATPNPASVEAAAQGWTSQGRRAGTAASSRAGAGAPQSVEPPRTEPAPPVDAAPPEAAPPGPIDLADTPFAATMRPTPPPPEPIGPPSRRSDRPRPMTPAPVDSGPADPRAFISHLMTENRMAPFYNPDPAPGYDAASDDRGEVRKGFEAGVDQLQALAGAGLAMAADPFVGTPGGADVKGAGLDLYRRNMAEAQASPPAVATVQEGRTPGQAADWFLYTLGNTAPSMLASIAGAVAGGLTGGATAGPGGAAFGAGAGAFAPSYLLNAGETYAALLEEGYDRAGAAALAGLPMALLDIVEPTRIAGRVLFRPVKAEFRRGLVQRMAAEAGKGALREGATETAQEAIKRFTVTTHTGEDFFTPEGVAQMVNAFAAGGVAGGSFAAAGGIVPDNASGVRPIGDQVQRSVEETTTDAVQSAVSEEPAEQRSGVPGDPPLADGVSLRTETPQPTMRERLESGAAMPQPPAPAAPVDFDPFLSQEAAPTPVPEGAAPAETVIGAEPAAGEVPMPAYDPDTGEETPGFYDEATGAWRPAEAAQEGQAQAAPQQPGGRAKNLELAPTVGETYSLMTGGRLKDEPVYISEVNAETISGTIVETGEPFTVPTQMARDGNYVFKSNLGYIYTAPDAPAAPKRSASDGEAAGLSSLSDDLVSAIFEEADRLSDTGGRLPVNAQEREALKAAGVQIDDRNFVTADEAQRLVDERLDRGAARRSASETTSEPATQADIEYDEATGAWRPAEAAQEGRGAPQPSAPSQPRQFGLAASQQPQQRPQRAPGADMAAPYQRASTPAQPLEATDAQAVDAAAADAAPPSEAQAEAGNYRKGHVRVQGLDVAIETPRGQERSGRGADGTPWSVRMPAHYGYVKRTEGADGDQVDVYIGRNPESERVWVIDQLDAETGRFDEHKAMLGFDRESQAQAAYAMAFSDGRAGERLGGITEMTVDAFRQWLRDGDTRAPLAARSAEGDGPELAGPAAETRAEPETTTSEAPSRADLERAVDQIRQVALGSRGSLAPKAIAKRLGIDEATATRALGLAAGRADSGVRQTPGGRYQRRPRRTQPYSAFEFLAARGGVRDDEGHDLANSIGQTFIPGMGPLIRVGGMDLDSAREALEEAGYIRGEQDLQGASYGSASTVNDVLDLLDREARGRKQYSTRDADFAAERQMAQERAARGPGEAEVREEIAALAAEHRLDLSDAETETALELVAGGATVEDAIIDAVTQTELARRDDAADKAQEQGDEAWDIPFPDLDRRAAPGADQGYAGARGEAAGPDGDRSPETPQGREPVGAGAGDAQNVAVSGRQSPSDALAALAEVPGVIAAIDQSTLRPAGRWMVLDEYQLAAAVRSIDLVSAFLRANGASGQAQMLDRHRDRIINLSQAEAIARTDLQFLKDVVRPALRAMQQNDGSYPTGMIEASLTRQATQMPERNRYMQALQDAVEAIDEAVRAAQPAARGQVSERAKQYRVDWFAAPTETVDTTLGAAEQTVIPGGERSARQAQAARDQQRGGRMRSEREQKPADEGLFATPDTTRDMFDAPAENRSDAGQGADTAPIATAQELARDSRQGKLKQSLLRSALERAQAEPNAQNISALQERIDASKAEIARSEGKGAAADARQEAEIERLAQARAADLKTVRRVKKALADLEKERERGSVSREGAFGAAAANALNDYSGRKAVLERALEIVRENGDQPNQAFTSKRASDEAAASPDRIEDFGEKLEGARKDTSTGFRKALQDDVDVSAEPLSKSFPQPDYEKLAAEGVSPRVLSAIAIMRDMIPNKPRKGYKLKAWADQVETLRGFSQQLLTGEINLAEFERRASDRKWLATIPLTMDLLEGVAPSDIKEAAQYRMEVGTYTMVAGEHFPQGRTFYSLRGPKGRMANNPFSNDPAMAGTLRESKEEALLLARRILRHDLEKSKQNDGSKRSKYTKTGIYQDRRTGEIYIAFKVRSSIIRIKGGFKTPKEARAYREDKADELQAKIDEMRAGPNMRGSENAPRQGENLREGDITPEDFSNAFGFRGVQFGNYVEGARRQEDLNRAYDALMDLADVLGIPPKAISLNGSLGLAFGARGKGGRDAAAAHFEPGSIVINLTKGSGPGSLAHEWLHALDNHFGRRETDGSVYLSEYRRRGAVGGVRDQVYDAWKAVEQAIAQGEFAARSARFDEVRSKPYWSTTIEKAARAFERYIVDRLDERGVRNDYLANIDMEGGAYPTSGEMQGQGIRAAYDQLFNAIDSRETDQGVELYSTPRDGEARRPARLISNRFDLRDLRRRMTPKLRAQLAAYGLSDKIALETVRFIRTRPGMIGQGMYSPADKMILVGLEVSSDQSPPWVLDHEVIHALRDLNVLRPIEWNALARAALADGPRMAEIRQRYKGLDQDALVEEAVADMFADWRAQRAPAANGAIQRAYIRIVNFFRALVGALRPLDVFREIEAGAIGRRRAAPSAEQAAKDSLPRGEQPKGISGADLTQPNGRVWSDLQDFNRRMLQGVRMGERFDTFRFFMQDKFIDLRRVQEAIARARGGVKMGENTDAYLAEELYHGRVGKQIDDFQKKTVEPLVRDIAAAGLTIEDVDAYLYALHAPERNARIAEINPDIPEGGSGMTDAEAAGIIEDFRRTGKEDALKGIAARVHEITAETMRQRVAGGLLSEKEASAWTSRYDAYVPLRGFAEANMDDEAPPQGSNIGKGFDIRGQESQQALGRTSKATELLANVLTAHEEAIVRAEKNKVGQTFLRMVQENPDKALWEVDREETKRRLNKKTGQVESVKDPTRALADNVLAVKVDGETKLITVHHKRLARAMRNVGADTGNDLLRVLQKANRFLAAINTSWNPEFMISNFARDIQTAGVNLQQFEVEKLTRRVMRDVGPALRGAYQSIRDTGGKGEWRTWFEEFAEEGGKTEFFGLDDLESKRKRIDRMLRDVNPNALGQMRRMFMQVEGYVQDVNSVVENGVRVATYANLRRSGVSKKRAASIAKNLTVNFNRRGEAGTTAGALYLFYNAAIQGTAIMLKALKHRRVQQAVAGIILANAALEVFNGMMSPEDDDGEKKYDKISDHTRTHNLVVMNPWAGDGDQDAIALKVPLPYGYNVFAVTGKAIGRGIRSAMDDAPGDYSPLADAAEIAALAVESFNPIGGEVDILRTIVPTMIKPFYETATNENFMGGPIKPEQPAFATPKPESQLYFRTVSTPSRHFANWLNEATGGSEVRPGAVDVSPEVLDHFFDFMTGGTGAFFGRSAETIGKAVTGQHGDLTWNDMPFARRVVEGNNLYYLQRRYYEVRDAALLTDKDIEVARANGDRERLRAVIKEYRPEIAAKRIMDRTDGLLKRLRNARDLIEASDLPDDEKRERLRKIEDRMDRVHTRALRLYNDAVKQHQRRDADE